MADRLICLVKLVTKCASPLVAARFQELKQDSQGLPEIVPQQECFPDNNAPMGASSHSARIREVFRWGFPVRGFPHQKFDQDI
jgi:hypothetical protein